MLRATVLDVPGNPFAGDGLRAESDLGLVIDDGVIIDRGPYPQLREQFPDLPVEQLRDGLLLPGLVDTHIHFPQIRAIGAMGRPLLDWLEHSILPEEARLADEAYARQLATEFVDNVIVSGTTTALVFGSHFAPAVDLFFGCASQRGLRATSGLVVSDTVLRDDLLTTPERAYEQGLALARRWHGNGRLRYAVTPRFSVSCSQGMLESCGALATEVEGALVTTHLNENRDEVVEVTKSFPGCIDYLDTYDRHGLVGARSVFAHNVHPTTRELDTLATADASVAHCPTSNAALASGMFPMREHAARGVRVALGSDVGAGTGPSLFKEGLQAYFVQQLLGKDGLALTPAHLLHLATSAGARALGLGDRVGDLSVGKQFDAVWVHPPAGSTLDVGLRHAGDDSDALAKVFALGTAADVRGVWIGGDKVV